MEMVDRIYAAREGGNVRRCHTTPHHGEYTVGKHSYDAANLLLILHPDPSLNLLKAVLWHDLGERWLGDVPAPAKWEYTTLAEQLRVAEDKARFRAGLIEEGLSDEDTQWLRAVDRLELWFWIKEQEALGNQHLINMRRMLMIWFETNWEIIPEPCKAAYMNSTFTRTEEII